MRGVQALSIGSVFPTFFLSASIWASKIAARNIYKSFCPGQVPSNPLAEPLSNDILRANIEEFLKKDVNDPSYSKVLSEISGKICSHLLFLRNSNNILNELHIRELDGLRRQIEDRALERIADSLDPESDEIEKRAFMVLAGLGFADGDFRKIADVLGFEQEDFPFVSLKLAEKGIYCRQHLIEKDIIANNSVDFMVAQTIWVLTSDQNNAPRPDINDFQETFWTKLPRILEHVDAKVARVFAIAFKSLTIFMAAITYNTINAPLAIIGLTIGILSKDASDPYVVSPTKFVKAGIIGRLFWMFMACNPWPHLFYSIGKALARRDLEVIRSVNFG
jgi:hypothetical protein